MPKLEYRLLTPPELAAGLEELPGWAVREDRLTKRFEFATYKDGLVFAVAVGHLADLLDHHPDMFVGYRKVEIELSTHSVNGLSPFDLELAEQIDRLVGG